MARWSSSRTNLARAAITFVEVASHRIASRIRVLIDVGWPDTRIREYEIGRRDVRTTAKGQRPRIGSRSSCSCGVEPNYSTTEMPVDSSGKFSIASQSLSVSFHECATIRRMRRQYSRLISDSDRETCLTVADSRVAPQWVIKDANSI